MVKIQGGSFYMGFDAKNALPMERPQHEVSLAGFCIDVTEVTVEAYKACSDASAARRNRGRLARHHAARRRTVRSATSTTPGAITHPINCVDWEMAQNYCKKQDKRLPDEHRGSTRCAADGRVFRGATIRRTPTTSTPAARSA